MCFRGAKGDTARGILRVGRSALREQDYVRASILLCTAMERQEQRSGGLPDRRRVKEIKDLQNALAHAGSRPHEVVQSAREDRAEMERILQEQYEWLESQV
jgi:hypothetical protein